MRGRVSLSWREVEALVCISNASCQRSSSVGCLTYPPNCPHPELGQGLSPVEPVGLPGRVCAVIAQELLQQLLRAAAGQGRDVCIDGSLLEAWQQVLEGSLRFELGSGPKAREGDEGEVVRDIARRIGVHGGGGGSSSSSANSPWRGSLVRAENWCPGFATGGPRGFLQTVTQSA